ncbi:unnamed protein product [Heligmosomoides polygyrus]|uniref:ANAPC4_WD40 domain-containing protein n=1 Tax=Heligmosomoides polygyrus TaxID=6339 RepID=A0A183FLR8_HELPZ|nr:unnamed protein product [Heligmosomoides polygyrus]
MDLVLVYCLCNYGKFFECLTSFPGLLTFKVRRTLYLFADQRPFVAMVDTYTTVPDRQYCSVSVVSLSNGKGVRRFAFEEPVCGLNNAARYLIVSLSTRLVIHDVVTLTELRSIRVVQPPESCSPAIALNQQFIAYADFKVSEMVTGKKHFSEGCAIMAHFAAHNEPLASMAWSPDGRLLLTTDTSACVFNVFSILTHPYTPLLSAVQHLYRLRRGTTIAKVVSCAFSLDCRWLSICTNHGTCHVFAISPYGGKPSRRTHGEHFTNKESRFLRSAGLAGVCSCPSVLFQHQYLTRSFRFLREHPCMWNRTMVRSTANPRIGPYPPPVMLDSVKKIRVRSSGFIHKISAVPP